MARERDGEKVPCTHRRPVGPRALLDERLGPGRSAAPDEDRLVLLPSGPDTVRGSSLRGTRSSTSLVAAACKDAVLGWEFSPAGADCRFRAPLVPRLARPLKSSRDASSVDQRPLDPSVKGRSMRPLPGRRSGGGEGGIRTRDGLPRTAFPVRRHSPLGDLSAEHGQPEPVRRQPLGRTEATPKAGPDDVAERAGFEPAVLSHTAFRERHHQPLGHLSAAEDSKAPRPGRPVDGPGAEVRRGDGFGGDGLCSLDEQNRPAGR